jgi:S-adenosylhomocysteine hydrolase
MKMKAKMFKAAGGEILVVRHAEFYETSQEYVVFCTDTKTGNEQLVHMTEAQFLAVPLYSFELRTTERYDGRLDKFVVSHLEPMEAAHS